MFHGGKVQKYVKGEDVHSLADGLTAQPERGKCGLRLQAYRLNLIIICTANRNSNVIHYIIKMEVHLELLKKKRIVS